FKEFSITKTTDTASPSFFVDLATGTHFQKVVLQKTKGGGDAGASTPFLTFDFRTVFVTKIDWSPDPAGSDETVETIHMLAGVLNMTVAGPSGGGGPVSGGWDQIRNRTADVAP